MRIILFVAFIALSFSSCNVYKDRKKVILGKKSNEVHTIKIEGDYTDMKGGLLQTLIGGLFSQSMNIKVDGTMKGKALLIGKSFYFQVDQDVKMN